jgi:hypothetical protein
VVVTVHIADIVRPTTTEAVTGVDPELADVT